MTQPEQCGCDYKDQHGLKNTLGIYQSDIYSSAKDIHSFKQAHKFKEKKVWNQGCSIWFCLRHANLHSRVLLQMKAEHTSWNVTVIKSNPNAEEENWDSFHCELWCEASQLLEDSHTFDLAEIVRNQPPWIQIVQQVIYNVIIGLKGLFEKSCKQ